jgi:N-ethylmaleimide reductase
MPENSLFTPIEFAGHTLKNRFALAPLTRGRAGAKRIPNLLMAEYYCQRATAGLIITEATVISAQGNGWVDSPGIYTDEMGAGWQQIIEHLAPKATPIVLQMWHCGRASHSDFHDGAPPVSASAIKLEGDHIHTPAGKKSYEVPHALTKAEINQTIADYHAAAERAKKAGFAGLELHAANGYLINQFLESKTNHRDDEYGGSIDNRFRLLKEIFEAVTTVYRPDQIGVRLSPNGVFNDMGSQDFREMTNYTVQALAEAKVGYLHIMDGLAFGFHELGEPYTLAETRKLYSGLIIGNCGYTAEAAKTQIDSGNADMIAFGRPYITNPDLPERIRQGQTLAPSEDMTHWYGGGAEGYTDYPTFAEAKAT